MTITLSIYHHLWCRSFLTGPITVTIRSAGGGRSAKEVVILGLGISERPEISDDFLEREAHDRDSIDLPNVQMLVERLGTRDEDASRDASWGGGYSYDN